MICHKSADIWKITNGKSSILVTLYSNMSIQKSSTENFNPTKEKPVHSLEHTSWIWAAQMEKKNETEPRWFICLGCCNQGSKGGFTPVTIQVGIGSFFRIYLQVSSKSFKPPVHANVPLGGQMSNLTPLGLFQYFDILIISCFWRFSEKSVLY